MMRTEALEEIISNISDYYIQEAIRVTARTKSKTYRVMRSAGRAAACLGIVFALSVSSLAVATAAGVMPAFDILYSLYPNTAIQLKPVNKFCEDNGIRMEVEAVHIQDNTAEIYISIQDMAGNRLDETVDLFDSYSIRSSCGQISGCAQVGFDADTKTATFLIKISQMGGREITGKKMTFRVSELLSKKKKMNEELKNISLENIPIVSKVQKEVAIRGRSGEELAQNDIKGFVIPDAGQRFSPIDGATITGYGFVDGKLHVQVYYEDILHYDNHGYIYLKDAEGNEINCLASIAFWDEEGAGSFEEYIFDIEPQDKLNDYSVWGYFSTCNTRIEGEWEVTFPIEQSD